MNAAEGFLRPERSSGRAIALDLGPLKVRIRNPGLAHAMTTVTEGAVTHELVEVPCLADVQVALVSLIERGLDTLGKLEARRS